jgi:hypothetical protein
MIDAENEIFSIVSTAVREVYANIYMTGEYVRVPHSFPCASLVEMDNSAYTESQTSSENENHAVLMYEVNVYSNKKNEKKSECKAIANLIDEQMAALGFTRMMLNPIPNIDDNTIYRMTGRYRAVISKDKTIYRR